MCCFSLGWQPYSNPNPIGCASPLPTASPFESHSSDSWKVTAENRPPTPCLAASQSPGLRTVSVGGHRLSTELSGELRSLNLEAILATCAKTCKRWKVKRKKTPPTSTVRSSSFGNLLQTIWMAARISTGKVANSPGSVPQTPTLRHGFEAKPRACISRLTTGHSSFGPQK